MCIRDRAEDAFEQRKNLAKKAGEEAGTKLMIPLFLMLIIVFAIILIDYIFCELLYRIYISNALYEIEKGA